ncbi:MAG: peptide chain release factor 1, partial [Chloroflexi bacterium CG_4_10_14_0_8_um_filter_57_5]
TDHRIGLSVHNLASVMEGNIDEFIEELATSDEAERLASLGEEDE